MARDAGGVPPQRVGSAGEWKQVFSVWAEGYRLVAIEAYRDGTGSGVAGCRSLDDYADQVYAVVEHIGGIAGARVHEGPRYFGFVIGGALDASIAADWLTSVWDQNGAGYPGGPSAAVAEEVACEWLLRSWRR